jgi:hypothetical protein
VPTLDQVIGLSEIKAITVLRGTEFKAALDKLRGCSMGKRSLVMGLNDAAAITLAIRIALADCTICTGDLRNDLVRILREITESLTVLTAVERAALRGERQTE